MSVDALGASVLVVDDSADIRNLLVQYLHTLGHVVTQAANGGKAWQLINQQPFDLVLLDMMMPGESGLSVLAKIKADPRLNHIPVLVISAVDDLSNIVQSISLGAEDFLPKPFELPLLRARITASLDRKRLHDNQLTQLHLIEQERATSEHLLLNVLPKPIADRLRSEQRLIVDQFSAGTVLFADIVGFTSLSIQLKPDDMLEWLNDIFSTYDELSREYGLEKIKTIGDCYMAAAGVPIPKADHVEAVALMALHMLDATTRMKTPQGDPFHLRIGLDTGPIVAGVIGTTKFSYDLWGNTVNTASRMESHGLPDRIQVTPAIRDQLLDRFVFEERGLINVKSIGDMQTYWLIGQR